MVPDICKYRADFPILDQHVNGKPLIYLDNAATTQKPRLVLDTVREFYVTANSNIHRGVHYLSEQASAAYEDARQKVRQFLNASSPAEIIFTGGTTAAVNLVADSFGRAFIKEGDHILITEMEHHSNLCPWQMLCQRRGGRLDYIPIDDRGELLLEKLPSLITSKTKLISVTYVSNVLGTINPVNKIIKTAHAAGIPVMVDAAQAVPHFKIDVSALDCDFLAFSGHKLYAETGIGVLYGKRKYLDAMPPYQAGGGMISRVSMQKTVAGETPFKFEAGTPHYAGAVSLGTAIDYLNTIGLDAVSAYESDLFGHAYERLDKLGGITLYGKARSQCAAISFNLDGIHPLDTGMVLDKLGIAVRTGALCAEPLMRHYGIDGTVRMSLALYNTRAEIDQFIDGLKTVKRMMAD